MECGMMLGASILITAWILRWLKIIPEPYTYDREAWDDREDDSGWDDYSFERMRTEENDYDDSYHAFRVR